MSRHLTTSLVAAAGIATASIAATAGAADGDSPRLAFGRSGDIYTYDLRGRAVRKLVASPAREHSPAYSPDRAKLAYVVERPGDADLYVANADGSKPVRVTRGRGSDYRPTWSPDGKRLAFASNRSGPWRIYVAGADGTGVRAIGPAGGGSFTPAWSPDGRRIAFSSSARTPENPEIYTIRPDGRALRRLTFTKGDVDTLGDDAWPTWSPDGRRIAFSSNRTGNGELWLMNADGSGQHRIAGLPRRDDWAPAFSPDGTRIAFHSIDALGNTRLYVVRADGSGLRSLGLRGEEPAWRP